MDQANAPTLTETLKEAVADRHARMEALPFISALTRGELPLASYVGQLRAMAIIHATLGHELAQAEAGVLRSPTLDRPARLAHLRQDLGAFDSMAIPDLKAAQLHVQRIATMIRLLRAGQPADLLGVVYVLEGSSLGNAALLPDALRIQGLPASGGTRYYEGYGSDTVRNWQAFRRVLDAIPLDPEGLRRVIRVALELFEHLEGLFSSLYPIEHAERVFAATMLNPEAGTHAVPQDAGTISAELAAGDQCRAEFPYVTERFQERGRQFSRSDVAWLATLADLPERDVLSQVEWLGGVLGNRGMPRLILERQLELLHAHLAALAPGQGSRPGPLLAVAGHLRRERHRRIPEASRSAMVRAFLLATDGELGGRFKNTGALLVAAVCDQDAGITGAVASLRDWLTDPERFPEAWIAAVNGIVQSAQAALTAGPKGGGS
jgi:heme oxygenase